MSDARKQPEAVVVGLSINGLSVARCLGRHGVRVIGIDRSPFPIGARSRYVRRMIDCQDVAGNGLVEELIELGREFGDRRALFPTSDLHVETVSRNRDALEPFYHFALPGQEVVEGLLHKDRFREIAIAAGFDVPATELIRDASDIRAAVESVGLPCVIKSAVKSPEFLRTFREKGILCRASEDADRVTTGDYDYSVPLVAQEWIPGGDGSVLFVLHYFNGQSEPLASFAGRKIRQTPPEVGHTASARPVHAPDAVAVSESFFRSVGAVGFCSMEFKRPPGTDRLVMIEPTVGRTDWQEDVAHINRVPIVTVGYTDMTGGEPPPMLANCKTTAWVEFEADIRSARYYIQRGELTWRGWLRSIWPFRPVVAALDDPVPGLAFIGRVAGRTLRKYVRITGIGAR